MATLDIDIKDDDLIALSKRLEKGKSLVNAAIRDSIEKSNRVMIREVKRVTPVDTGRLKRGWRSRRLHRTNKGLGEVSNKVPYGIFVNDGTRFIKPRRFVEKSINRANPKITVIMRKELDKVMRKLARKGFI